MRRKMIHNSEKNSKYTLYFRIVSHNVCIANVQQQQKNEYGCYATLEKCRRRDAFTHKDCRRREQRVHTHMHIHTMANWKIQATFRIDIISNLNT